MSKFPRSGVSGTSIHSMSGVVRKDPFSRKIGNKRLIENAKTKSAMYERMNMKSCIVCDSPKASYSWLGISFCSVHRENASRFMKAFPSAMSLERAGISRIQEQL